MSDERLYKLGEFMAAISQDCWFASWLSGCEEEIPKLARAAVATGQPQEWGMWGVIDVEDATTLCHMADDLGHWADQVGVADDGRLMYAEYHPTCDADTTFPDGLTPGEQDNGKRGE